MKNLSKEQIEKISNILKYPKVVSDLIKDNDHNNIQKYIIRLLASIMFYGEFVPETNNEMMLLVLMDKIGFVFQTEDELISKIYELYGNEDYEQINKTVSIK